MKGGCERFVIHSQQGMSISLSTARMLAVLTTIGAISVLVGWQVDQATLKSLLPALVAMNPMTAICFMLAGIALRLSIPGPSHPASDASRYIRRIASIAIVLIGSLKLFDLVFGTSLGIDQMLFAQRLDASPTGVPNRMAPNTALCFVLIGSALLTIDTEWPRGIRPAQLLALLVGGIAQLALIGYFFSTSHFTAVSSYIPMALNTSILFLFLSLGVLLSRPGSGVSMLLYSSTAGGALARRLLVAALIVPILLGWLWLVGQRAGWFTPEFGVSLMVVVSVALFAFFIWRTGLSLHRAELQRREVEEALQRASEEVFDLYNNAPCGYHSLDEQEYFVQVNDTELHWLGYTREELIGTRRFPDVITAESLAVFQKNFPVLLERGSIENLEFDMVRKDGTTFPVLLNASAVRDTEGRFVRSRSTLFDMTERTKAEVALKKLAAIVESTDDAVIGKTLEGIITSWNRGAQQIYGYTAGEVIGKSISILVPDQRNDEVPAILSRIARGERISHYDTVRRRKDGTLINVALTISPISNAAGTVVGASAIARDVTELKAAEERITNLNIRLQEHARELETVNRELEAFSYSVSHDLRAPLRSIQGFANILEDEHGPKLGPEGLRLLEIIKRSSTQMGQLIDDLLSFSRVSRTKLSLRETPMTDLVRSTFEELMVHNGGRRVEFVANDLPPAYCDPAMVKQILANLLSNALKFTQKRDDGGKIEVGGTPSGEVNEYYVRDNGVGFDMKYVEKLFGVFQRLHKAKDFEGTGVGLAIVQRIVTRHGGTVRAVSGPDAGATFYFTLPARDTS
jgi:PAS domain S-box-containing protein